MTFFAAEARRERLLNSLTSKIIIINFYVRVFSFLFFLYLLVMCIRVIIEHYIEGNEVLLKTLIFITIVIVV